MIKLEKRIAKAGDIVFCPAHIAPSGQVYPHAIGVVLQAGDVTDDDEGCERDHDELVVVGASSLSQAKANWVRLSCLARDFVDPYGRWRTQ